MLRPKIYYKYTTLDSIVPSGGAMINELNMIEALHTFADVYNSGFKYLGNYKFDTKKVSLNYDRFIIRANKEKFLSLKTKDKYWIASPYDKECFTIARKILCFSNTWAKYLKEGKKLIGLNPDGLMWSNAANIDQCVSDTFLKSKLSSSSDTKIVLGYFGRIVETTKPYLLKVSWDHLNKVIPNVKLIACVNKGIFPISGYNVLLKKNVAYTAIPSLMGSCNCIINLQHGSEFDYCGNLKIKEAAACGVPLICQESNARKEELGNDYPLFISKQPDKITNSSFNEFDVLKFTNTIKKAIELSKDKKFSDSLKEKMTKYSKENIAKQYKAVLEL